MKTIKISELKTINPQLALKCVNIDHSTWTDWVCPEKISYCASCNNNGPKGWIKIVTD